LGLYELHLTGVEDSRSTLMSVQLLNPNADVARRGLALQVNLNAALGLQNVVKTNLGPRGTLKMYSLNVCEMMTF
jgi:hypothetical protein